MLPWTVRSWRIVGSGGFRYTLAADALTDELGEEDILLADTGYDSNAIRAKAAERKAWATWFYRQRNLVERFFNRIKQFRGIASRYDKRPETTSPPKLIAARISKCMNRRPSHPNPKFVS
ncbi:hypothetical protein EME01_63690 [Sinorhizobium meliloti]|nr:hypothetical protein [Sinorhizobium meliloti]GEC42297.1 hypothetical protein EME01_63690 [Sinorhizobium meliloti]